MMDHDRSTIKLNQHSQTQWHTSTIRQPQEIKEQPVNLSRTLCLFALTLLHEVERRAARESIWIHLDTSKIQWLIQWFVMILTYFQRENCDFWVYHGLPNSWTKLYLAFSTRLSFHNQSNLFEPGLDVPDVSAVIHFQVFRVTLNHAPFWTARLPNRFDMIWWIKTMKLNESMTYRTCLILACGFIGTPNFIQNYSYRMIEKRQPHVSW